MAGGPDVTKKLEDSFRLPDYSGPQVSWPQYPESRPYVSPRLLMVDRYSRFLDDYLAVVDPATRAPGENRSQRISLFERDARRLGVVVRYDPTLVADHSNLPRSSEKNELASQSATERP